MTENILERLRKFDKGSKVIKLFNPNESRTEMGCPPRLCINTYVGCSHQCAYCYNHWMKGFDKPHEKKGFEKALKQDIEKIFDQGLNNLIVSISNSTDPFQEPVEDIHKHSLFSLKLLSEKGLRVLILTKNPAKLLEQNYLAAIKPATTAVEVTVPFLHERKNLEPFAPSIEERLSSIEGLLQKGINKLAVRVDPLIPAEIGGQSAEELEQLISKLKDIGVSHIISKVFRLVGAIGKVNPDFYKSATKYYIAAGAKWHKNHYKLPVEKKHELLNAVYEPCRSHGLTLSVCYEDFQMPGVVSCDMAESKLGVCVNS